MNEAKEIFGGTDVIITTEGQRHLGAVIGSKDYRDKYVMGLVKGWVDEVNMLTEIARHDPHSAYTAYTYGLVHKWGYFQRTIPETEHLYQPLEDAIRYKFLPALTRKDCSDIERQLFAMPCYSLD